MKKFSILKLVIGIVLISAVFLLINSTGFSNKIKNSFYSFSSSLQERIWNVGDGVSDFFSGLFNSGSLKRERDILLFQKMELLSRLSQEEILKQENETLRDALELKTEEGFDLILAKVIGKDELDDSVLINKGLKDGVLKDMPVITAEKVLIGKTLAVYDDFSQVLLLSNKDFSFDIQVFQKGAFGVSKGDGGLKSWIDFIPKDKEIASGDLILTSVLGGIFPEGLLVGEITKVISSNVESFQQAEVDLYLPFLEMQDLLIIKDF